MKRYETEVACRDGATEIDMVINVGKALSGDLVYVERDVSAVVEEAHRHGAIVKVILENDFLPNDAIKIALCGACERAGAEFVKTSTGYGFVKGQDGKYSYEGATEHDLALMRAHTSAKVQVKAAGGVRDLDALIRVRDLGTTRCGATATAAMLDDYRRRAAAEAAGGGPSPSSGGKVGAEATDEDHAQRPRAHQRPGRLPEHVGHGAEGRLRLLLRQLPHEDVARDVDRVVDEAVAGDRDRPGAAGLRQALPAVQVLHGDGIAPRRLRRRIERLRPEAEEAVPAGEVVETGSVRRPARAAEPVVGARDLDRPRAAAVDRQGEDRQRAVRVAEEHRQPTVVPGEVRVEKGLLAGVEDGPLAAVGHVPQHELRPAAHQRARLVLGEPEDATLPAQLAARLSRTAHEPGELPADGALPRQRPPWGDACPHAQGAHRLAQVQRLAAAREVQQAVLELPLVLGPRTRCEQERAVARGWCQNFGASSWVNCCGEDTGPASEPVDHSSTTAFQFGRNSRPPLDTAAANVIAEPEVSGSGGPDTRRSGPIPTRKRLMPSMVVPAPTSTCDPYQATGTWTASSRGQPLASPVGTAGPPSTGATHQSRSRGCESRAPLNSKWRPSGDQIGPTPPGGSGVPNSGWKGRGSPPSAATTNIGRSPLALHATSLTKATCVPSGEKRAAWPRSTRRRGWPPSVGTTNSARSRWER